MIGFPSYEGKLKKKKNIFFSTENMVNIKNNKHTEITPYIRRAASF